MMNSHLRRVKVQATKPIETPSDRGVATSKKDENTAWFSKLSEYLGLYVIYVFISGWAFIDFYFRDVTDYEPEGLKHFTPENKPRLQRLREAFAKLPAFDSPSLEAALKSVAAELGVKAGALVHPLRVACTGKSIGPSLYHLMEILGRDISKALNGSSCAMAKQVTRPANVR